MKKRKIAALLLAVVTLLAGCGNTSNESTENNITDTKSTQNETTSENEDTSESEPPNTTSVEIQNTEENETETNVLIAYFSRIGNIDSEHEVDAIASASVVVREDDLLGNLEYMATLLQNETGGDIHFIETAEKYPSEYDSSDDNALDIQVNLENRDNARPELATHIDNMDAYDTVFLGFPNWLAYHNLIQCTQA